MANNIFLDSQSELVQMSNGLTSAIIAVVCLAGSSIARTDDEKKIIIWLAQRDQSIRGLGLVSFDIRNMPWSSSTFDNQKEFLVRIINAAMQKTNWDKLDYEPREDWVLDHLSKFRQLIIQLDQYEILPEENPIWAFYGEKKIFQKCEQHGVFLHAEGCVICNDR